MPSLDASIFTDIAYELGIGNPAIVEKDYWAIQLLADLSKRPLENYQLVFSGGTCLAKTHQNLHRMSEDIDIKLVPTIETLSKSGEQQKKLRRATGQIITEMIRQSQHFSLEPSPNAAEVDNPTKRDGYKFQQWLIQYPKSHRIEGTLRPHLQLELTESELLEPAQKRSIRSFYAEAFQQASEVTSMPCVSARLTATEKFVALLRKTAAVSKNAERKDDPTLIRHLYDLHILCTSITDLGEDNALLSKVINADVKRFGKQHPAFGQSPYDELAQGLLLLSQDPLHKKRYDLFIGPLVYHPSPARWEEALSSLKDLASHWLSATDSDLSHV